jgi:hypothetical protein
MFCTRIRSVAVSGARIRGRRLVGIRTGSENALMKIGLSTE